MPSLHPLPVPPALLSRACEQVDRRVGRLPFQCGDRSVGRDLVAAALEELNAEPTRTLALRHRVADGGRVQADGLDRHLAQRGFADGGAAAAVGGVLVQAGIAQKSSVTDRRSRRILPAIRLLPAWTWTVVTAHRDPFPGTVMAGDGDPAAPVWTDLCPVCRAGTLRPVTGQRLYGIAETDFTACTSCGARFVPKAGRFTLVAIAKKQDPLQADLLNCSLTPAEWQAVAQGEDVRVAGSPKTRTTIATGRKDGRSGGSRAARGRLALEVGSQIRYFSLLPVHVSRSSIRDLFAKRQEPLREILRHAAYAGIAQEAAERYRHYLDVPVGPFLLGLKDRRDASYRKFLNRYGDSTFCTFRTTASRVAEQRGVFVVATNDGTVLAAGASLRPFCETINGDLGDLSPPACYLDGDPDRCRVNSLLCSRSSRAGLFVHPLDDRDGIARIAAELTARLPATGSGSADDPARSL